MLLERYRKEARKILDKSFEPDRLCKVIDAKYKLIKDDLKVDPFPHRRATVPGDRGYDDIVDSMKAFVRKRYASAVEQLDKPGERPKVERPPGPSAATGRQDPANPEACGGDAARRSGRLADRQADAAARPGGARRQVG